jgi:hypothetical protein
MLARAGATRSTLRTADGAFRLIQSLLLLRGGECFGARSDFMGKPFDVQELTRALEQSQATVLRELYVDDATMKIIDRDRPPSKPLVIEGKARIAEFWQDVCSRDMSHKVTNVVAGEGGVSFVEECLYPDGCRVMSAMTLKLRDGRISEHLTVQAWDEVSCS